MASRERAGAGRPTAMRSWWWSVPKRLGDEVGVAELVALDRRRADSKPMLKVCRPVLAALGEQADDQARVEPAGEQHADRHVGDLPSLDGEAQRRRGRRPASRAASMSARGVAARRSPGPSSGGRSGGRRARCAGPWPASSRRTLGEDRARRRHDRVEASGSGAAPPGRCRCRRPRRPAAPAASRRSADRPSSLVQVQRLDAEPVAGEHHPPVVALDRRRRRTCPGGGRPAAHPTGASP